MRRLLLTFLVAGTVLNAFGVLPPGRALAEECKGENCPPPEGDKSGGHGCDRDEAATS